ncbi:DUF1127 domain-containing protein [Loktanella sp. SALINAS62]|uniref:DUF1127 domain-containing protein n=1 Tax=Loktanella sp. SALINAS62 TaxID=2706124 RepID=UPI001B8D8C5B|nr:DUF1127 domain-containing protein [Loktanella sp. SALINAS62]MBS1301437.1 DUF1127 domain-containing protein [Loktanella sp. SALINAS62]
MTTTTTNTAIRNETLMARVATSLRNARARRNAYRRTRDELSAMTDYELADIGVTRGMITAVAREAAERAV